MTGLCQWGGPFGGYEKVNASTEMPRYKSHKTVWALKIAAIEILQDGRAKIAPKDQGYAAFETTLPYKPVFKGDENDLGYYVQYADGYVSWSPSKAFEDGYKPSDQEKHDGLPVAGYKPQNQKAVDEVNHNKQMEEMILRRLDVLDRIDIGGTAVDLRWLAIARMHIEQGFMAANRAIFQPTRVVLTDDRG